MKIWKRVGRGGWIAYAPLGSKVMSYLKKGQADQLNRIVEGNVMTQPDQYLLGRGEAEKARLKRQIAELAPVSDAQLDRVGIQAGERVVDLGCGPGGVLHLLAKRVGPTGSD